MVHRANLLVTLAAMAYACVLHEALCKERWCWSNAKHQLSPALQVLLTRFVAMLGGALIEQMPELCGELNA